MKKILISYYSLVLNGLFIINNIFFRNLIVKGILYYSIMIFVMGLNVLILVREKQKIKYKSCSIIMLLLTFIFAKNIYYAIFSISSIITLIITGFMESNFIKLLALLISIFLFFSHAFIILVAYYLFFLIKIVIYMKIRIIFVVITQKLIHILQVRWIVFITARVSIMRF